MSRTIAIATAAIITMGVMAASASSASARSYGHQSYSNSSCHTKTFKVPAWKTVWKFKKVYNGCGWSKIKVRRTVKVWRTKYKRVCH